MQISECDRRTYYVRRQAVPACSGASAAEEVKRDALRTTDDEGPRSKNLISQVKSLPVRELGDFKLVKALSMLAKKVDLSYRWSILVGSSWKFSGHSGKRSR